MYKRTNKDQTEWFGLNKPDNTEATDITEKEIVWLYLAKGFDEKAVKEMIKQHLSTKTNIDG